MLTTMQTTPNYTYRLNLTKQTQSKFQLCLKDIKMWISCNFLLLSSDKSGITVLDPSHLRNKSLIDSLDDIF